MSKTAVKVRVKSYRPIVIRKGEDAARKIGMKFGGYVKTTAQRSIKKRNKKGDPSQPGEAVRDVTGAFKRFIRFEFDESSRKVLIGPTLLPGRTKNAPKALEKGGSVVTSVLEGEGKKRHRVTKRINIEERPTMRLALAKSLPALPKMWAGAIRQ